jgi:hypothetical protein
MGAIMKGNEPTAQQILAIKCPNCGAKPDEKCRLGGGQARNIPHRDRRLAAKDALATRDARADVNQVAARIVKEAPEEK